MGLLDALKAATADVQSEPKSVAKTTTDKTKKKATAKPGCAYVIPESFKTAIEGYLKKRGDMKEKMKNPEKSISGCCDYIFDVMRKRAEKEAKGARSVGLYADPDEIFGLAVHYYDESEESLKAET